MRRYLYYAEVYSCLCDIIVRSLDDKLTDWWVEILTETVTNHDSKVEALLMRQLKVQIDAWICHWDRYIAPTVIKEDLHLKNEVEEQEKSAEDGKDATFGCGHGLLVLLSDSEGWWLTKSI